MKSIKLFETLTATMTGQSCWRYHLSPLIEGAFSLDFGRKFLPKDNNVIQPNDLIRISCSDKSSAFKKKQYGMDYNWDLISQDQVLYMGPGTKWKTGRRTSWNEDPWFDNGD